MKIPDSSYETSFNILLRV